MSHPSAWTKEKISTTKLFSFRTKKKCPKLKSHFLNLLVFGDPIEFLMPHPSPWTKVKLSTTKLFSYRTKKVIVIGSHYREPLSKYIFSDEYSRDVKMSRVDRVAVHFTFFCWIAAYILKFVLPPTISNSKCNI